MYHYFKSLIVRKESGEVLLGRWKRLSCDRQLAYRVKQANEDNSCVGCEKVVRDVVKVEPKDDEYLRVFCI